ncbi:MAG TPA: polyketide cyclase [Dysgonomonas sp.]|nr:polyketide cyclase [Dysgonomonas sp.]
MAEYISETKIIAYPQERVFSAFSDLRKIEQIKEHLSEENKSINITYEKDSCIVDVSPVGNVRFVVTEREPDSRIKFEAEQLPFKLDLLVLLNSEKVEETSMQVIVNAELNPFLKPMVSRPLQDLLEKMASTLSSIPYNEINEIEESEDDQTVNVSGENAQETE